MVGRRCGRSDVVVAAVGHRWRELLCDCCVVGVVGVTQLKSVTRIVESLHFDALALLLDLLLALAAATAVTVCCSCCLVGVGLRHAAVSVALVVVEEHGVGEELIDGVLGAGARLLLQAHDGRRFVCLLLMLLCLLLMLVSRLCSASIGRRRWLAAAALAVASGRREWHELGLLLDLFVLLAVVVVVIAIVVAGDRCGRLTRLIAGDIVAIRCVGGGGELALVHVHIIIVSSSTRIVAVAVLLAFIVVDLDIVVIVDVVVVLLCG